MTISWFSKPRSIQLLTLFTILQISACSTEDFANAIADNIVSDGASSASTVSVSDANPEVTLNPTPEPTPDTSPSPAPTPAPVIGTAMYSYNANLSNAQPLSGAVLEQTTVYLFFNDASGYSSMKFYCCNGIDGASDGEAHQPAVSDSSAPFVYTVNTSQFTTTGSRELYVDAARSDGTGFDSISVNFSLNITSIPVTPAPTPTADINLSWIAPSEREDNTVMSLSDIAGYKIYYGTTKGNYTDSVNVNDATATEYTFSSFTTGTYYFVITTRDIDGRESQYSSVVTIVI